MFFLLSDAPTPTLAGAAMLCDDIVAAAAPSFRLSNSPITSESRAMLHGVADLLSRAARFVFDRNAIAAVQQVGHSRPSSVIAGLALCRGPAEVVYIEFAEKDRQDGQREVFPNMPPLPAGNFLPSRVGYLFRFDDETMQRGSLFFVWDNPTNTLPQVAGLSARFDFSAGAFLQPDAKASDIRDQWRNGHSSVFRRFARDDGEVTAAMRLNRHLAFEPNEFWNEIVHGWIRSGNSSMARQFYEASYRDIREETTGAVAALMMLNSKSCVTTTPNDLSNINRARGGRGKAPLLPYHTVKLDLSRGQANRARAAGLAGAELRAHLCRGHFKIRKTGVYWWSPHIRGNATLGRVDKSWRVTA